MPRTLRLTLIGHRTLRTNIILHENVATFDDAVLRDVFPTPEWTVLTLATSTGPSDVGNMGLSRPRMFHGIILNCAIEQVAHPAKLYEEWHFSHIIIFHPPPSFPPPPQTRNKRAKTCLLHMELLFRQCAQSSKSMCT